MTDGQEQNRKPCIALMGEFSAGKSTLANLLIGANPLPVQVVATQLPPVLISFGTKPPFRVDLDGNNFPVDLENLTQAPLDDTLYIRIFCEEDILRQCDLLDMPGISDPNMASDVWQRMISRADGVLWCSHATQAWRQSEAAVWAEMPSKLYEHSLLLLTRVDKLTSEQDRTKVIRRVKKETQGLFLDCLPISLLQAIHEQSDYETWAQSGAGDFAKSLAALLRKLSVETHPGAEPKNECEGAESLSEVPMRAASRVQRQEHSEISEHKVTPRRVAVQASDQRPLDPSEPL